MARSRKRDRSGSIKNYEERDWQIGFETIKVEKENNLMNYINKVFPRHTFTFVIFVLIFLLLLIPYNNVIAQNDYPSDDQVNAIAKELYCPVCENIPLDVCPTQACAQWRALIKEKMIAGWSKDEIKQYFVDQYGDRVLAQPPARGLNLLVYILPPVVFMGGVVVVYLNLKKIKKIPEKEIQESKINDDKYLQEIEEALNVLNKKEDLS
jgi:cytochrome c-type biogenesis protein CcmH